MTTHITMTVTGRLVGLTPRGWFHIQWLHLNRPQLIIWRQKQQYEAELQQALRQSQAAQQSLRERIHVLEQEVAELQKLISRLF